MDIILHMIFHIFDNKSEQKYFHNQQFFKKTIFFEHPMREKFTGSNARKICFKLLIDVDYSSESNQVDNQT